MKSRMNLLTLFVFVLSACASSHGQSSQGAPPAGLDLRAKILEFTRTHRQSLNAFEDNFISLERAFNDRMRHTLRDAEAQITEAMAAEGDWKKAKRDAKDATRRIQGDMKQQVRIQREQFELEILRFTKEREAAVKGFYDNMKSQIAPYRNDKDYSRGYAQADADLNEAKSELMESISNFKTLVKNLKPKENFWE